jgi:SAM-dependent methyltransferase
MNHSDLGRRDCIIWDGRGDWEKDYADRGKLWGGVAHTLPELPSASRVLELGCGNGKTLRAMLKCGWDVTAIDFSYHAAALSRNVGKSEIEGNIAIADARMLPFHNAAFDGVIAIHIVGHMLKNDRGRIAFEAIRVLKPGGILYFCDFTLKDFRFGKGDIIEEGTFRRGNGIITHYFTKEESMVLFSGLTPVSMTAHEWSLRVRGKNLVRSEITAVLKK